MWSGEVAPSVTCPGWNRDRAKALECPYGIALTIKVRVAWQAPTVTMGQVSGRMSKGRPA